MVQAPGAGANIADDFADMEAALKEADIQDARDDFAAFLEYVMINEEGEEWKCAQHQHEWGDILESEEEMIVLIGPRQSAKSTTIAGWIMYRIGKDPNTTIKYVCGADDLAVDKLRFIKDNIQNNKRYHEVFPHVKPAAGQEWTKHKIFVERDASHGLQDATIEAVGVTSSGTGGRAHILVFDDIIDARSAIMQPSLIPKIKGLVEEDWMNLLYPQGKAVFIGTFWSFDPPDIYVEYSNRKDYYVWKKPACDIDSAGRLCGPVLWEDRWPLKQLEKKRRQVGDRFGQQYLLKGGNVRFTVFNMTYVNQCMNDLYELGDVPEFGFDGMVKVIGVDPARSMKRTGSHSVVFVAMIGEGQRMPVEILRGKWDPEELAEIVIQQYLAHAPKVILVENNSYQVALMSLVRVLGSHQGIEGIPLKGHFTGSQKWSPDAGLPRLNAEMSQAKWIVPMKGDHDRDNVGHRDICPICAWVDEMHKYGRAVTSSDIIMAWWLASTAADVHTLIGDLPVGGARRRQMVSYG